MYLLFLCKKKLRSSNQVAINSYYIFHANVCVCECVCVCVCVCVCLCSSIVKTSSVQDVWDILEWLIGTNQRGYVAGIIPGDSNKFLHLHFWKSHYSPPKKKLQHMKKLERNDIICLAHEKMIYINIGYKLVSKRNRRVMSRY